MEEREEGLERLNMKKAKIQFQQELESYLEEEKVFDTFQDMMVNIIKDMPSDPIQYLIDKMTKPQSKYKINVRYTFFFRKANHRCYSTRHEGRRRENE